MIENNLYGFFGDDLFFDDTESRLLDGTKNFDWLTFIIPVQTGGDQSAIKTALIKATDESKAFGVTYDILYQT
jgi:hypothetical protein